MRSRAVAVATLLTVTMPFAACGGGGGSGSSSSTGASVAAFCEKVKEFEQLKDPSSYLPNDLSGAKRAWAEWVQKLREVDAVTPAAVNPDVDNILSLSRDINSIVQGASSVQELRRSLPRIESDTNAMKSSVSPETSFEHQHCNQ